MFTRERRVTFFFSFTISRSPLPSVSPTAAVSFSFTHVPPLASTHTYTVHSPWFGHAIYAPTNTAAAMLSVKRKYAMQVDLTHASVEQQKRCKLAAHSGTEDALFVTLQWKEHGAVATIKFMQAVTTVGMWNQPEIKHAAQIYFQKALPYVQFGSFVADTKETVLEWLLSRVHTEAYKLLHTLQIGDMHFVSACCAMTMCRIREQESRDKDAVVKHPYYEGTATSLFLAYSRNCIPDSQDEFKLLEWCLENGASIHARSLTSVDQSLPDLLTRWIPSPGRTCVAILWALKRGYDINTTHPSITSFLHHCILNCNHAVLSELMHEGYMRNVDLVSPRVKLPYTAWMNLMQYSSVMVGTGGPDRQLIHHMLLSTRKLQQEFTAARLVEHLIPDLASVVREYLE
jgi:hypothetical protein